MGAIWRKEWIQAFESPWSIFEKMSFVNFTERNEIMRVLGKFEVRNSTSFKISEKNKELINLSGFDHIMLCEVLKYNLVSHNQNSIKYLTNYIRYFHDSVELWFAMNLRWCEECLSYGHHSWLHQFKLMDNCPFHEQKLNNRCSKCLQNIPFMLSNQRLSQPFTCKCGHALADFSKNRWANWDTKFKIVDSKTIKWIELNQAESNPNIRWLFQPDFISLETLASKNALFHQTKSTFNNLNIEVLRSQGFKERVFKESKNAFRAVDRFIRKKYLKNHKRCIHNLRSLNKPISGDFPSICPYAFAYTFWRTSLLQLDHFYYSNQRCDDIPPQQTGFYGVCKIINQEIEYLLYEYTRQHERYGTAIESESLWIMQTFTMSFCLNFFKSWLKIAREKSVQISVPSKAELVLMKNESYPNGAFKYYVGENTKHIEYYATPLRHLFIPVYKCPTETLAARKKNLQLKSHLPQQISMLLFENPNRENMDIKLNVERFVSKLNI